MPPSSIVFIDLLRKRPQVVGSLAGLARCREDGAVVILEELYPVVDVFCMPQLAFDFEVSAQEGGGEFCDLS
jgi:hypothetical protein